jgi:DNA modification methylase
MPGDMLDRGMGSVLSCSTVSPTARVHPTEKPVDLLVTLIEAVPGVQVFDPFMGSGSTGVAAVKAGREFIGCEINPHHFGTACARIAAELAAPRMFTERPAPAHQEALAL